MTATAWLPEELAEVAADGAALLGDAGSDGDPATHPLRVATARAAVRWAVQVFGPAVTVASSMGDEVLVHLARGAEPAIDVFFIDTGLHFPETLATAEAYAQASPAGLRIVRPLQSVPEQEDAHGPRLWARDPDACCGLRKVEPLERALRGRAAWVTGMRRVDAPTRTDIDIVGWDARRQMVKLNPLASWTDEDVQRYAAQEDVTMNPLRERGYASIGCAPCTRPVAVGEDPRAGRWSGTEKTECGLHT